MTQRTQRLALGGLFAAAFVLYLSTASRTIGWWDDSHYAFLSATLSISNPPGSLLLTLLGWLWTRVRWCQTFAFQLHVLAALLGAATVALVARCTSRTVASPLGASDAAMLAGVAAGAWLLSAFHFWTYATQFTPYGLTALFTALLSSAFLHWWQRAEHADDVAGLAVVALVLGLDFSVHRTNQLLMPGLLIGALLRRPRMFLRPAPAAAALLAYLAGVSTQAGYFILSARQPRMDMADLHSWADLYRFVRLDPIGGNFLVDLWPRHADFVRVQLADWVRFLWTNLGAAPVTRVAALALAVAGAIAMWRRSWRLACALLALFLSAGLGAVFYFNRPVSYMRPLDRHYLASLVILAPFVGAGLHAALAALRPSRAARLQSVPIGLMLAIVVWNVTVNHVRCDRSRTRYAETWARDLLEPLPPRAILFTNGDNDTFPLMVLQEAEHVRTDVLVVNLPVLHVPSRQRWIQRADTAFAHVRFGEHPDSDLVEANRWHRPVYAAVTVETDAWPGLKHERSLEGLAYRLLPPGAPVPDDSALARFVRERLPRAGLRDRRQVLEPEMEQMFSNYAYTGVQLVRAQMGRDDVRAAYLTLELLQRELSGARLGRSGAVVEKFIDDNLQVLRESASAPGISP